MPKKPAIYKKKENEENLEYPGRHETLACFPNLILNKPRSPEQKLLLHIVLRALYDLHDPSPKHRSSAFQFLNSTSQEELSFLWILDHLNIPAPNPTTLKAQTLSAITTEKNKNSYKYLSPSLKLPTKK